MVLVGNDNDKNAGFVGGIGVGEVFRRSSNISPMRVADVAPHSSGGGGGDVATSCHRHCVLLVGNTRLESI